MSSLVLELQSQALDESVSVTSLLLKAKTVSVKLNVQSIKQWIECELSGYSRDDDIPNYREVTGTTVCWDDDQQCYRPLEIQNLRLFEIVRKRRLAQPLSQIADICSYQGSSFVVNYSLKAAAWLKNQMQFPLEPGLEVQKTAFNVILSEVRKRILEFTLELESQGILGENMTFTKEEKLAAATVSYNTINIGNMSNSQIQQASNNSQQHVVSQQNATDLLEVIEKLLSDTDLIKVDAVNAKSLIADIETIKSQLKSIHPKKSIIKECLLSIKAIIESAAGGVLANTYSPLISQLLTALI